MTKMALIEWLLFLIMIARTKGRESSVYSDGEEIMETILESCYGQYSSPNPVLIFGNFNRLIEGVSIIRINDSLNITNYEEHGSLKFKASSIVFMGEPPRILFSHLEQLRSTKLWDNLIPFFIIAENGDPCTNSRVVLKEMWKMEILNSIYICHNSIHNRSEIYTLNPITNYAPYPWKRIDKIRDLNIFCQNFDANNSCTHLTYDKTKILNGYNVLVVAWKAAEAGFLPGINYFPLLVEAEYVPIPDEALRTIIIALNASCNFEYETSVNAVVERYHGGSVDIVAGMSTLPSFRGHPYLFPLRENKMIAVVKLRAEVSTLEKIRHIWSTPVLIAAGCALAVFFLILMIKTWSFGSALLDLTRFLTYVSIQTDNRYQSFRIYFTTMLILIVISNGVFQSKIAAFLTTRERSSPAKSINELTKLEYNMYVHKDALKYAKKGCPSCKFRGVSTVGICIKLVLDGTKNVCVMDKLLYESYFMLEPVDRAKESFNSVLSSFTSRVNWPLRERFNYMIMRIVESGLMNLWEVRPTSIPKAKRQSIEADRASAQYRPVTLAKLDFAFELLAVGLSLATIIFILELFRARGSILQCREYFMRVGNVFRARKIFRRKFLSRVKFNFPCKSISDTKEKCIAIKKKSRGKKSDTDIFSYGA